MATEWRQQFTEFKQQFTDSRQVLADFKNQTINRLRQFRERIGMVTPLPNEQDSARIINNEFDRLYGDAGIIGLPAGAVHANIDLIKRFIKKDKVLWHTRIVRSIRSAVVPRGITSMIQEIISATYK